MDEKLPSEPKETLNLKVWHESKKVWRIAFSAMLARVSSFGMFVVTQAFIGHISKVDLAAYSLIQVITVRFAYGIILGMSSATETLCGQAFGANQHHMLGIYLQRSWIINLFTTTILLPLFIFVSPILNLLNQKEEISSRAGYISLWFIPILYSFVFSATIQKFLQTQLKNKIVGWLSVASFAIHVLLSWIFVRKLNWGIPGAMSAMIISTWILILGEFVYIFGGWCPNTWKGFTSSCFKDLLPVVKLSISSGVMLCLQLWYNAILVILAGYMKDATIAISTFSICLNIIGWVLMISLGFFTASSVRISNELGRKNVNATKFAIKVTFSTSLFVGVFFAALCMIFAHQIGYLFTKDDQVAKSVSQFSDLISFSVLFNSVMAVLSGVAVGAGRQAIVAYVNIGSYYVIGVPLGAILGYVAHMEIKGLWIGMLIGVVIQSAILAFITARTNWEEQINKASKRLNKNHPSESDVELDSLPNPSRESA